MGDPTSSYATIGIAPNFIEARKPPRPHGQCFDKTMSPDKLPLILRVAGKLNKKHHGNICKWSLDIEFERDQSVSFCAMSGDSHRQT